MEEKRNEMKRNKMKKNCHSKIILKMKKIILRQTNTYIDISKIKKSDFFY
jgi:hypothetical protein